MERHLLLVDDEANVLAALRRALRRDGYTIHTAESGVAGLEILAAEPVAVIVSDQRMPHMTGSEFLARARELKPNTVRIMLSGFSEVQALADAINQGAAWKFLFKPWEDDQLRGHIANAFEQYELGETNRVLTLALQVAGEEMGKLNEMLTQRFESAHAKTQAELAESWARWNNLPLAAVELDAQGFVMAANRRAGDFQPGQGLVTDWPALLAGRAADGSGRHPNLGHYWLQPFTAADRSGFVMLFSPPEKS